MTSPSLTDKSVPAAVARPRLVISACLLGDRVRYDGNHKLDQLLAGALAEHVQWCAICPEVELGLGVPREKVQLEVVGEGVQLVAQQSRQDLTGAMQEWADRWSDSCQEDTICGFVLKSGSPSCGIGDARVWKEEEFSRNGTGLFAATVIRDFPCVPVVTEEQLRHPGQLEHFLVRIFARHRLIKLLADDDVDQRRQRLAEEQMLLETHRKGCFEGLVSTRDKMELKMEHAGVLARPCGWTEHRQSLLAICGELEGERCRELERRIRDSSGDDSWSDWATEVLCQARDTGSPLASQSYLQPFPSGCFSIR
jgi:uncharacterized protein YbbK (DUF523 family)